MHLKRNKIPKSWPLPRKGTKFLVLTSHNLEKGIPVLVVLRDIMKICQDKKEAKKIIHDKKIFVNNKRINDEKFPLTILDVFKIGEKYYRVFFSESGKFELKEIDKNKAKYKICKIIDKKIMKKNKIQVNLNDGRNFISDKDIKIGDFVLIDLEKNKIEKTIPLKEKRRVLIISGKYMGKQGVIEKIDEKNKVVLILPGKINIKIDNIMVIENDL